MGFLTGFCKIKSSFYGVGRHDRESYNGNTAGEICFFLEYSTRNIIPMDYQTISFRSYFPCALDDLTYIFQWLMIKNYNCHREQPWKWVRGEWQLWTWLHKVNDPGWKLFFPEWTASTDDIIPVAKYGMIDSVSSLLLYLHLSTPGCNFADYNG